MYLKLILCYVKKENQPEFAERQRAWNAIKEVKGLIFQLGGWDTVNMDIACKLALWENETLYREFHLNVHDTLAAKAGHAHLYYKIEADFFFPISYDTTVSDLPAVLKDSSYLRLADCRVNPLHHYRFLQAQQEIWIPAMQQTDGMLGGFFSQNETEKNRYLVSSFWKNKLQHDTYAKDLLPGLRQKSKVSETVDQIRGFYVNLLPEWTAQGNLLNAYTSGF